MPSVPIGITSQPETFQPIAPPPEPPPAPVVNRQGHAAADARPVAAAAELLRNAATKFEQHLGTIDPTPFTEIGLHQQISAFANSPAAKQIDEAISLVNQRDAAAKATVADVLRGLSPQGDTASELRNTRAWDRARRQLDAVHTERVAEAARTLIGGSDDDELGVLLAELPSYLASKGSSSEWLETSVGQRVPALADAQRKAVLATQARQIVERDAGALRKRITGTASPQSYRPVGFISVAEYDPDFGA